MLKNVTIVIGIMLLAFVSNANAQSATDPAAAIKQDESKKTSVLRSMVIHQQPKNGLQFLALPCPACQTE